MKEEKLVRGRLKKEFAQEVKQFITIPLFKTSSELLFKIYNYINIAHVIMLNESKIIKLTETKALLKFLLEMESRNDCPVEYDVGGEFYLDLENFIIKNLGSKIGGKIHTARSRNDLLATAHKIAGRRPLCEIIKKLINFRECEISIATKNFNTVMPGYTHLQQAQPITLAHYFVGHNSALNRDVNRLINCFNIINECPLGAGALSGVTFKINRERTCELLGFDKVMVNTLDAIATRDYCADITYNFSLIASDLSRLSEDLYLWNTIEFGFIDIDDQYCEISSIMPQKKNPFIIEHFRSKTGKIYGSLIAILTVLKGITFSQSRDLTGEIFPSFLNAYNEINSIVSIFPGLLETLKFNKSRMEQHAGSGFSTVTDLVDFLVVNENISFRDAHHIVAKIVSSLIDKNKSYKDIDQNELEYASKKIINEKISIKTEILQKILSPKECILRRSINGGPAPSSVKNMIKSAEAEIEKQQKILYNYEKEWSIAKEETLKIAKAIINT